MEAIKALLMGDGGRVVAYKMHYCGFPALCHCSLISCKAEGYVDILGLNETF